MGYYRGEYEEYYRNIRMSTNGKSFYTRGSSYGRERNVINSSSRYNNRGNGFRGGDKKGREHLYDFLKILGIQTIAVCTIGALVYGSGLIKDINAKKVNEIVVKVIKSDYYFGEDKLINEMKAKVLNNSNIIEGIEKDKDKDLETFKEMEEEKNKEIKLEELKMIMPTKGIEKKLGDGKVQIKGEKVVFSTKSGEITYVKDGKVIINHGEKLETVYEKVGTVEVKKGDKVEVNERIGVNDKKGEGVIFYVLKDGKMQNIKP
ncbi:MAG: M23 family metallopeptidase [Clostridium sp.]